MTRMTVSAVMLSAGMCAMASHPEETPGYLDNDSTDIMLDEVVINATQSGRVSKLNNPLNTIDIGKDFLSTKWSGSLMQTISAIPGVSAISVGATQSKPAIRGMGFDRMIVTSNGIKHEGQQWGEEHGLEMDQFSLDRVEIIKGPAAIIYGPDAIGGVLNTYSQRVPNTPLKGYVRIFGDSGNDLLGFTGQLAGRRSQWLYRADITASANGDTRVPTNSIQYYSYDIPLKDGRLRNTAGRDIAASVLCGWQGERLKATLSVSDNYSKTGFFADLHGLEVRLSNIDYDKSAYDIDLPYHQVNHLKVQGSTLWNLDFGRLAFDIAWQNNLRREYSEPMSHGYMPKPDGTLEREFIKNTFTFNARGESFLAGHHEITYGLGAEWQHNERGGWGFIIPAFTTSTAGAYGLYRYHCTDNLILSAGLRYDFIHTHIESYSDWYPVPGPNGEPEYKTRSREGVYSFGSLTWSAGMNYLCGFWTFKANVGKSFRAPIPKELGTDGINYHIFRYEQGNPNLKPEESYQLDTGIGWDNGVLTVNVDPFVNYFPNYIYLNPTSGYQEGMQVYVYSQSRVFRYGGELEITYRPITQLELNAGAEYLYAIQLSGDKKGYTLPFSPPLSLNISAKYTFSRLLCAGEAYVSAGSRLVAPQNRVVPPEPTTPGYASFDISAGKTFNLKSSRLSVNIKVTNLFNRRYFDHTSYYRLVDVPEPGRNISVMVGYEF